MQDCLLVAAARGPVAGSSRYLPRRVGARQTRFTVADDPATELLMSPLEAFLRAPPLCCGQADGTHGWGQNDAGGDRQECIVFQQSPHDASLCHRRVHHLRSNAANEFRETMHPAGSAKSGVGVMCMGKVGAGYRFDKPLGPAAPQE